MKYKEESIRKTLAKNLLPYSVDAGFYELQNALDWVMNAPESEWDNRTFTAIHASQNDYNRDDLYKWVFKGEVPEAPKPTLEELKERRDETQAQLLDTIANTREKLGSSQEAPNPQEKLDSSEDEIKEGEITPEQLKAIEELEEAIKDVSIKTATQCFLAVLLREARKRGGCFDHATMKFGEFTIEVKHNEP